jgi:hypothetical protein
VSIVGVLDAQVGVYRQNQTQTDSLGDIDTPTFVGQFRATLQMPRLGSRDEGAGDRPTGIYLLMFEKRATVMLNDIIQIRSGPNVGKWLILTTDPFIMGRSSHIEANAKTYVGKLPNV